MALDLLGRAFEAARKALRDLEAKQVPASLRPVVAHPGKLVRHLVAPLVEAIDEHEWLRERSLEAWPEADTEPGAPDRASALFLRRPSGWEFELAQIAHERGTVQGAADVGKTDREVKNLEKALAAAKDREAKARKRSEALEAEMRQLRKQMADPIRSERAAESRARADLEAEQARAATDRAGLEERLSGAVNEADTLRRELIEIRRDRAAVLRRLEESRGGAAWTDRDPIAMATHFDDMAAQARLSRDTPEAEGEGTVTPFALPAGVSPDQAEAIDALTRHRGALLVLVDGYNVGLKLSDGTAPEIRERLHDALDRIVTLSDGALRPVVIWDSAVEESGSVRRGRLEVRFPPAGRSADDEIVELAQQSDIPVVVLSSDREVRELSEAAGAMPLWAEAFVRWAQRR